MLCSCLHTDKVLPMLGRIRAAVKSEDMVHSMSAIYGSVAKASGLRGEWSLARRYSKLCTEAADEEASGSHPDAIGDQNIDNEDLEATPEGSDDVRPKKTTAVGGKRAWKDMDLAREQSLAVSTYIQFYLMIGSSFIMILCQVYREHRRSELRQEMEMLNTFVSRSCPVDISFYERVFSFDSASHSLLAPGISSQEHLPLLLLKNLVEKFGIDYFIQRKLNLPSPLNNKNSSIIKVLSQLDRVNGLLFGAVSCKKSGKKKNKKGKTITGSEDVDDRIQVANVLAEAEGNDSTDSADGIFRRIGRHINSSVGHEGKLDFNSIFSGSEKGKKDGPMPVKMEICSGSGEWAARQVIL